MTIAIREDPQPSVATGSRRPQEAPRWWRSRPAPSTEAWDAFVGGIVVLEVVALLLFTALSPAVGPDEEHANVVLRALACDEVIAHQDAGRVDEARGARQRLSLSIASCNDARMRSNASWSPMVIPPLSPGNARRAGRARKRSLCAAPGFGSASLPLPPAPRGRSTVQGICTVSCDCGLRCFFATIKIAVSDRKNTPLYWV